MMNAAALSTPYPGLCTMDCRSYARSAVFSGSPRSLGVFQLAGAQGVGPTRSTMAERSVAAVNAGAFGEFLTRIWRSAVPVSRCAVVNWMNAELIVALGGTPRRWKRRPTNPPCPKRSAGLLSTTVGPPSACATSSLPALIVFADETAPTTGPSQSQEHRMALRSFDGAMYWSSSPTIWPQLTRARSSIASIAPQAAKDTGNRTDRGSPNARVIKDLGAMANLLETQR